MSSPAVRAWARTAGNTDPEGQAWVVRLEVEVEPFHRQDRSTLRGGFWHHAKAPILQVGQRVGLTKCCAEGLGDQCRFSVGPVVTLPTIDDLDHADGDGTQVSPGCSDSTVERNHEVLLVQQAGDRINQGCAPCTRVGEDDRGRYTTGSLLSG